MSRTEPEIDAKNSEILQLGDFFFHMKYKQLRDRNGARVTLRSQSMQVLAELFEHRGELVSKDVLTDTVWPNTFVTDDSLVQCIADIRRALGDTDHDIVQTVPKRGNLVAATTVANADVDDERNGAQPERWRWHSRTMPALATVLALLAVGFGYLVLRAGHVVPPE